MQLETWRVWARAAVCSALLGGVITYAAADERTSSARAERAPRARFAAPDDLNGFALVRDARLEDGRLWSRLRGGERAELSVDPGLQAYVRKIFTRYAVPEAAFVAIEPASGRVIAYVSHSRTRPSIDVVTDSSPPAASIFKIVTSAALVDAGVGSEVRTCYNGGSSSIGRAHLKDDPRRDKSCATLAQALGSSTNAIFAKRAVRHLDRATLRRYARVFGFGQPLPTELRSRASAAEIPGDSLELARAAAGFWHTHLSPLHGATIGAMLANRGIMPNVRIVDRVLGKGDRVLLERPAGAQAGRRVLPAATAREVGAMMERTVREGTSRGAFFDPRGLPFLPGVEVAGKTGSLSANNPYRAYNWWVGFAPADKPVVAIAALVVNPAKWRIKSSYVARAALQYWLPRAGCASASASAARVTAGRCAKLQRK